ncbi:MAG: PAS domain-containing protein [Candidatus Aminicenantes bacterium]|nr:MAG: PAS domain-containing protein [Candidatus Aminicenantes bacterium]
MFTRNNIKDKENFCNALLEAIPIPVLVVNPDVQILYFNPAAAIFLKFQRISFKIQFDGN